MPRETSAPHPHSICALDAAVPDAWTWRPKTVGPAPWEPPPPAEPPAAEPVERPESYLSKQSLAAHYAMSVRWVEQRISDGLPVADYLDKRPRFRLSETDTWLRQSGHLTPERPKAPRPGTKVGA